jgi:hypothetical protein
MGNDSAQAGPNQIALRGDATGEKQDMKALIACSTLRREGIASRSAYRRASPLDGTAFRGRMEKTTK